MKLSIQKKWTFSERYVREAIYFGIPMVCMELIGVPVFGWAIVLIIAVPVTLVGLLFTTIIEHFLISILAKRNLP